MFKWLQKFFVSLNKFFIKNYIAFDKLPQHIFSALLIAAILNVLSLSSGQSNSRFFLIFFIGLVVVMSFAIVLSRWKVQIDKISEEKRKVENEKEQLGKALGIRFEYITNTIRSDSEGNKYYDPSEMYKKLQNYIREAKSVKLLDNVYSDLDDENSQIQEMHPKTEERKKWLALIKYKLNTDKDFVYQRIFYKFDSSVSSSEYNRIQKNIEILSYVRGDTRNHINELSPIAKSRPANCSIKFLAHNRAMETFIIIDNNYLIFQIDGIEIDQSMPQDLLVMKNIEESKELIITYEARFQKISELASSIETALIDFPDDAYIAQL